MPKKRHQSRRPSSRTSPQRTPPGQQPRRPGAGAKARNVASPPSGFRAAVEARSAAILVVLTRLPRWLVPALVGALLLFGLLFAGVFGALALAIVLVFVVWLTYLSWPAIGAGGRLMRVVLIGLVLAAIVLALVGA